jgi:hypothetical protein
MTPLAAACAHAERWPIFPCKPWPDKSPLTEHGLYDATKDPAQITSWWWQWPQALIGMPTGERSGVVVLDVDIRDPRANGFDALDELGFAILPVTRMVHTPTVHDGSTGLHLHFTAPEKPIHNTAGKRGCGIGPGLDWRGSGGYVILPSPGSGYWFDPVLGLDTPLAAIPPELLPRAAERPVVARPIRPATGLSPYAEAAIDSACRRIVGAPRGEQEMTLNGEAFAIGTLVGAGAVPRDFALKALLWAASQIRSFDLGHPWRQVDIENKVRRAFADGCARPRGRLA